jgi:hypothetical protein
LEEAHTIAEMHKDIMPGDYARVLFKLAEAKENGDDKAKSEALAKKKEAEELLTIRRPESGVALDVEGEAAYDSLVYILWR